MPVEEVRLATLPRAFTVPGIDQNVAIRAAVAWARAQRELAGAGISIYVPQRQNLSGGIAAVDGLLKTGIAVRIKRQGPAGGVVIALWPDQEMLLDVDERSDVSACVAVTWDAGSTEAWAIAHDATPLGGPAPATKIRPLDPVVAEAIDSLRDLVGQHKPAVGPRRAAIGKGLLMLRGGGYELSATDIYTHAIATNWSAENTSLLRDLVIKVLDGRPIQGTGKAPLADGALHLWQAKARRVEQTDEAHTPNRLDL